MATLSKDAFDGKAREARVPAASYSQPMIHQVMNRSEWGILVALALIWGAAFFFIKVAVTHVEPLTYVWLRLTIAAAALWLVLIRRGDRLGLPVSVWTAILLLALLNNIIPFALFGWGQTAYRERTGLDPQRDHPDLGRHCRAFPDQRRADDPAPSPRRVGRVCRRRNDDRARARDGRRRHASLAGMSCRRPMLCARRGLGAPLQETGRFADESRDRPIDRRGACHGCRSHC